MILIRIFNLLSRQNKINTRFYSMFPKTYVKPIFRKEEQELYKDENDLSRMNFRPALPSNTCSEFYDELVSKVINYIMRQGKKNVARLQLERTFENIKILQLKQYYELPPKERDNVILDPKVILYRAVENCTPILGLIDVSRGGIIYKVPVPLDEKRGKFLSIKWLIESAQDKPDQEKFFDNFAKELLEASNNEGKSIKKKHELHKKCEANRAYAHYRWM